MDDNPIERMRSLLDGFGPILEEAKRRRRQTASRFNVADAFGVTYDELAQSKFLKYLLDPSERHDQGDIFLASLLKYLGLAFLPTSVEGAHVTTEAVLGAHGRVDILIGLSNGQLILIENKVMAKETPCQIGRYQKWLNGQGGPTEFPHQTVFLTPEGRRPVSTAEPEKVICLSYARLADWIGSIPKGVEAVKLREVLEQYADACWQIGGPTRRHVMPDEIRAFLFDRNDPGRLEAALELEAFVADLKEEAVKTFCKEIKNEINRLLDDCGYVNWVTQFDDDLLNGYQFKNWRGWRIEFANSQSLRNYAVKVEFVPRKGMSFGITRGFDLPDEKKPPQHEKQLRKSLIKRGFSPTDNYVGLKPFHSIRPRSLPRFDFSTDNDVLTLLREMQDEDRPLTHQVVNQVWQLFVHFREDLENLNGIDPQ